MKKLLALIGSPHKNGRTASVVKKVVEGAESSKASTQIYYLNNMNINYCQGCMECKKEGQDCCVIQDDMQKIYKDFKDADAVIIGSPIYTFQISAQTKILFDRFYALLDSKFNRRFNVKKAVIVYSQWDPSLDLQSYYDVNAQFFKKFGLDTIDTIIYSGYDEKTKEEIMTRALECGKKLVE